MMKIYKLSIVLIIITLFSMPAWAKFCSECGKPLNDGAKFCSECGAGVGSNTNTEVKEHKEVNEIKVDKGNIENKEVKEVKEAKKDLEIVKEKLDCFEEFCIYLESANQKGCMEKFPDCKIKFNKGLEELSKKTINRQSKNSH